MALALTLLKRHAVGGVTHALIQLTFSGTYPDDGSGFSGEPVDFAATMGYTNKKPDLVTINSGQHGSNQVFFFLYDKPNNKVKVISLASGAELFITTAYSSGLLGDTILALVTYISTPSA